MQGNAVAVPPIIEIQHSHASNFTKTLMDPQPPIGGPKADVQFPMLWRYWLGHLTRKIVSEMTYNVSSGTLNTTIPW